MFQFAQRRKMYFLVSAMIIIPGLIAMIYSTISNGSPVLLSIDFTGGTLMDISFVDKVSEQTVRDALDNATGPNGDKLVDEYVVQQLDPIEEDADTASRKAASRFLITFPETASEDAALLQGITSMTDAATAFFTDTTKSGLPAIYENTVIEEDKDTTVQFIRFDEIEAALTMDISFAEAVSDEQLTAALDTFKTENSEALGGAFNLDAITFETLEVMPGQAGSRWQVRIDTTDNTKLDELRTYLQTNISGYWTPDITNPEREITSSSVSATVGKEVTRAALLATLAVAVIILFFIVWAFRQVPHAIRYGTCAIIAMFHDILVTMGVMSILGLLFGWEADALFLTAVLTVVGYSVQDTIVVFDRIRENIPKYRGEDYDVIVNRSVLETIHRSLMTQLNAIFVMLAILLFGGETIRQFIAILLIGMLSGTYSSIFNAVPLLVSWEKGELPFVNRDAKKHNREEATAAS
ncbi:MAG TPA: protein translocase subunit SecF [Aggregatilineaceae bacterium]|nr:protein translocase subunit SecF [Aggregatilineaceae bacterium]